MSDYPNYIYHGDRIAKAYGSPWCGQICTAVRRQDGKCIRGKKGTMLVVFQCKTVVNVVARTLRKVK